MSNSNKNPKIKIIGGNEKNVPQGYYYYSVQSPFELSYSAVPIMDKNPLLHKNITGFYNKSIQAMLDNYKQFSEPIAKILNSILDFVTADFPKRSWKTIYDYYNFEQQMKLLELFLKYGNPYTRMFNELAVSYPLLIDAFLNRPVSAIKEYQMSYIDPFIMSNFIRALGGR